MDTFRTFQYANAIDLSYNSITNIEQLLFKNSNQLIMLILIDNKIEIIEKNAFYGLDRLVTLKLNENRINSIHVD